MLVNPEKVQAKVLLDIRKSDLTDKNMKVGNKNILVDSDVNVRSLNIDHQLNFNLHLGKICQSESNQFSALTRLKRCLDKNKRNVLVDSFIYQVLIVVLLSAYL